MKTVAGVFDTQVQAERAVSELSKLGLAEDSIRTVRRSGLDSSGRGIFASLANAIRPGDDAASSSLTALGLSSEEAEFYDQELDEDGALVIVYTSDEHHDEVMRIMRSAEGVTRDAGS